MNRKGLTIISLFFYALIFLVLWFIFVGPILGFWGANAVTTYGLTGVDAFAWDNLNFLVIFIPFLLWILASLYSGGNQ